MCYLKLEQEYGILAHFKSGDGVLEHVKSLLNVPNLKAEIEIKRNLMIKDFINPTEFMVWFIETYPDSLRIMQENPDYQYNFR